MLYLDTSTLAKLVTLEAKSDRLRAYLAARANGVRFSSALAHAELLRAAHHLGNAAVGTARAVLARVELVDVSLELLERVGTLAAGHHLRTLDAIQVVTATVAGDRLEALVTCDLRMADAAAALTLPIEQP